MHCRCNFRVGVVWLGRLCPPQLSAYRQAYRYALYKLNPFAITGSPALYDGINAQDELNRYNPTTGNLTEQYLKDRAAMLSWKLQFGTHDTQPVGDTFVKLQSGTPFYFEDFTSNAITTKMRIGGGDSVNAVMSRPQGDFHPNGSVQADPFDCGFGF